MMKENYVDMGNGVLWATSNITRDPDGSYKYKLADNPEDFGCYFSWGDIAGHNAPDFYDNYSFSLSYYERGLSGSGNQLTFDFTSGDSSKDAAARCLGDDWRMPTYDELKWLIDNCNPTWTTLNGVNGELFTNPNDSSKTLFFPANGYYDEKTLYSSRDYGSYWSTKCNGISLANYLYFNDLFCNADSYGNRHFGRAIRPVMNTTNNITIEVDVINETLYGLPSYKTKGSAGMDLRANIKDSITIKPFERILIPTGVKIGLPKGHVAYIMSRSGLTLKNGIIVGNAPGVIDEDYTGEIKVILVNLSNEEFIINAGDRVAQLIFSKYEKANWNEVYNLEDTERGDGGFGHSGIK